MGDFMDDLITLIKILKLEEEELKKELYNHLLNIGMSVVSRENFLYAPGKIPVLLVAHMDTVFDYPPKRLCYDKEKKIIFSTEGGIGADDRCGIYAILEILKKLRPYVLFTSGEEIGGIGADDAAFELEKPNVKYMIEIDRHGSNDCVFYNCGNEKFINYVESFGFETQDGIFSDISILGPEWDIAAVNLSSGYYHEHTEREYIKFLELQYNIERIKKMLKRAKWTRYYDFQSIYENMEPFYFDDQYFSTIDLLNSSEYQKKITKGTWEKGDNLQ